MTTLTLANTIQEPVAHAPPAPAKLSEGWHYTEKYGEVFVAPGGNAWVVQQSGDRLINVTVKLNSTDIVQRPAIEKVKRASAERRRYNLALAARKQSGFALSQARDMTTEQDTSGMK